jgi:hypothetical protein
MLNAINDTDLCQRMADKIIIEVNTASPSYEGKTR